MIVFYTTSTQHFAKQMHFQQGRYTSKQFSDGEWYIKLEQDVAGKVVWVVAATNPPAEHIVELLLLLDALQRARAHIKILFTYFGYARQDQPEKGEASSAQLMARMFGLFEIQRIMILHSHSNFLHDYLPFKEVVPDDLICIHAQGYDALVAPDQGAHDLVQRLATLCNKEAIYVSKMRPEQEMVTIQEYNGTVPAKNILIIDDMIATGNTVIEVAKKLKELGASHVSVWATHGIFSGNAYEAIQKSCIEKVYVTDSVPQKNNSSKIEVISIAPLIEKIIMQN
jgi:ribose-phosphate pyrophosphokinase